MRQKRRIASITLLLLLTLVPVFPAAQLRIQPAPITNEAWTRPFPAFRIAGDLYYVGGYDLASYLIVTRAGHILINTGLAESVAPIRSNVESLGLKFEDVKILLATHGHWDHVAGMAEIKRQTGASMMMHEGDVPILEDGGASDFRFGGNGSTYQPVKVDRRLRDGDRIELGGTEITVHHHPGHTKGASSFSFVTRDDQRSYRVLIANMGSINEGVKVLGMPEYPDIAADYRRTFASQKAMQFDIWVSSHAGQFRLHDKHKPGDPYDPSRFMDQAGYRTQVERLEQSYLQQLEKERAGTR